MQFSYLSLFGRQTSNSIVRSLSHQPHPALTMSANDLESTQNCIHRLFPLSRRIYAANQPTNGSGSQTVGSTAPSSHMNGGGGGSSAASAVNIKFATINHHAPAASMSHSHSTGDVASIFGRAWPGPGSLFGTLTGGGSRKRDAAPKEWAPPILWSPGPAAVLAPAPTIILQDYIQFIDKSMGYIVVNSVPDGMRIECSRTGKCHEPNISKELSGCLLFISLQCACVQLSRQFMLYIFKITSW